MTRPEKKKQSYKLGHNRQTFRFKDLLIKNKWHDTAILGFFMSPSIEEYLLYLIIHKNF